MYRGPCGQRLVKHQLDVTYNQLVFTALSDELGIQSVAKVHSHVDFLH